MKLSQEKRTLLYTAISDPIMAQRILLQRHGAPSADILDERFFKLQNEIWRRVHKALNIEGAA